MITQEENRVGKRFVGAGLVFGAVAIGGLLYGTGLAGIKVVAVSAVVLIGIGVGFLIDV